MKLDQLVAQDGTTFNAAEWSCLMELGPLSGSLPAQMIDGHILPSGRAYLRFEYTAAADHTFIGYTILRRAPGSYLVRTVRSDTWVPAFVAKAGAVVQIEVFIEPEDWA